MKLIEDVVTDFESSISRCSDALMDNKINLKFSICFKESIRDHEHDLIEEFPNLNYLRQLALNDPNKLQDQTLGTIFFYSPNYFDFSSSDGCKSSFVSGANVTD